MSRSYDSHPREETVVFTLNGVTYVPHYSKTGLFVSPGYGLTHAVELTGADLIRAGAKQEVRFLWSRGA